MTRSSAMSWTFGGVGAREMFNASPLGVSARSPRDSGEEGIADRGCSRLGL